MDTGQFARRRERLCVLLLCLLGMVHVFVFSAAFPFFSVVDEQVHLDLVVRYSHGDIPRTLSPPDPEALRFMVLFDTLDYLWPPVTQTNGAPILPKWKRPMAAITNELLAAEAGYHEKFRNHEASSPPLYYAIAGAWWRLGRLLNLDGIELLYWARFLNAPLVAAIVWLGWLAGRKVFPDNIFIRLAVPACIAFLPQTTFYAINNDVLAPLTFGAAFLLLVMTWESSKLSPGLGAATGLALAAAFLTKTSNVPLIGAAGIFLALLALRMARNGKLRNARLPFLLLLLAAVLPMAAWMAWCKVNFGDLTGSEAKIRFLGWTHQPIAAWLRHPIFTPSGGWYFLSHNISTFWQGEQLWHRRPLASPGLDWVYVVFTLGALALTLVGWLRQPPLYTTTQREALGLGFLCVGAAFAFFALLSVSYDFHDCFYPSRALPYFVSGRLMLGMLIPFMILFACGLDRMMHPFPNSLKFGLLSGLTALMVASEAMIDKPVFANAGNWFHQ